MSYSTQIANKLVSHMEERGYKYEFDREKGHFRLNFSVKCSLNRVRFILVLHDDFYVSYGCIDMNVKEDRRQEIAEFITRANYGLNFGNFELDMRDGEIRYKHTVDCDHCTLSSEMIENSLDIPLAMYNRYGDEMLKVMFGMQDAETGIRNAESK